MDRACYTVISMRDLVYKFKVIWAEFISNVVRCSIFQGCFKFTTGCSCVWYLGLPLHSRVKICFWNIFSPLIFYQMVHHIQLVGSQDLRPRRKMQKTHDLYQWLIGSLRSELAKSDIFCVNPINRGYTRLTCTCALINVFQDVLHTDDTEFINVDALLTGMVHIWNHLALGQHSTCCIRVIAISLLSTPSTYYFLLLL